MRSQNEMLLKDVLSNMIKEYRLKANLNETKIRSCWEEVMGKSIANYTTKIELKKNILILNISSASLSQELSFRKEKIMQLVNEKLGEKCVAEVQIY